MNSKRTVRKYTDYDKRIDWNDYKNEYIKYDEDYYNGYEDYNSINKKSMYDYVDELKEFRELYEMKQEALMESDNKSYLVKERYYDYSGIDKVDKISEFVYNNDTLKDVYIFMYGYEPTNEELYLYFVDRGFLEDSQIFKRALARHIKALKLKHSLKTRSKGEEFFEDFLIDRNIEYETEVHDGCYNDLTGYPLWFDFILYINGFKIYVEIQGLQHYEEVKIWDKNKEDLKYRQYKDNLKKLHANKNGIYVALDYREHDLNILSIRIETQLLPIIKECMEYDK